MPEMEPASQLLSLDDSKLETLHESLHADITDSAAVELHHLVTTELGRRGYDHGHRADKWSQAEIVIDTAHNVSLLDMAGSLPLQDHEMFVKELGMTRGDVTVVLTVDGYEMRVDPPTEIVVDKAYDPESNLSPRQQALYAAIEDIAARFGDFDCGSGPDGAHYIPAADNVFVDKGIRCANCIFYDGGGGCEIMDMEVEADAACKFWVIPESLVVEPEMEPLVPLVSADDLMKHGNHDQSTHGHGGTATLSHAPIEAGELSPATRREVDSILPRKVQRELYGSSFESGKIDRDDNPTLASVRAETWRKRRDESVAALPKSSNDEDRGFHADRIMSAQGYLDGAAGNKAVYTRPMMGLSDFLSIDKSAVVKHGNHDQSSHGRRGNSQTVSLNSPQKVTEAVKAGRSVTVQPDAIDDCLRHMADTEGVPDLALVTVEGTDLFGKGNKGIARADMPQIPDVAKERFLSDMDAAGIKVTRERVSPKSLHPIQKEISGKKSGSIMKNMESGGRIPDTDEARIFITNDGFVLDGHHRWAAAAALDASGGGFDMPVFKIDLPYDEAVSRIKDWNASVGIRALAMGEDNPTQVFKSVVEKHYDHDQSTHGNRGGIPAVVKKKMPSSTPKDVRSAVLGVKAQAAEFEPTLTAELMADAKDLGGTMEGLQFRLKTDESLAGKVEREMSMHPDAKACAASMSDVVRYTMSFPEESYASSAETTISKLEDKGYKVRTKNFWAKGDPYQGLNLAVTHPNGMTFELQIHTPTSYKTKDAQHIKYEKFRKARTTKERWQQWSSMARQARSVSIPAGAENIGGQGARKIQPFTIRHSNGAETVVPESLNIYKNAMGVRSVLQSKGEEDER